MSDQRLYYFDNNATTRVAPEVVEAMLPLLTDHWGNPSSAYSFGHGTSRYLDEARCRIAELIHCDPREIVFTSCGTESNNTALHSALRAQPEKRHLIMTAVEHSANLNYAQALAKQGYEVTLLPVDSSGRLELSALEKALRPDTAVVSIMLANNETGMIFPVAEAASICQSKGVLFHTDAVQAPGKIPLDVKALGADLMSLSAHKLHAPKGIGLLYVKRRTRFFPYLIGGHQEKGRRGGTENVAGIVAFGKAAQLAMDRLGDENTRVRGMRDRMEETLLRTIPRSYRNGASEPRLPNTSNIAFDWVEAEAVLLMLDQLGICASSGSACTTGSLDPSHVLSAMGITPARCRGSLRLSLSYYTREEEVDYLLRHLPDIIVRLRAMSPSYPGSMEASDPPAAG